MNLLKTVALSCLMVLSFATTCLAAESTTPTAWGGVGSTFGPGGLNIAPGKLSVGGCVVFAESNGIWESDERRNGNAKTTKLNEIVKLRYGIMDGLDIRTSTPIYNVHIDKATGANQENYGVGDTTMLLHQRLFSQKAGDWFSLALDFGGILPTASVGEHSSNPSGNDAWGLMVGLGATYFIGANRFDSEVSYASWAEGAREYEKGDRFRWNLGYAYALSDRWDIGVESAFEMSQESETAGMANADAYQEWYVGPKVVFKYKPWSLFTGLILKAPVQRWYEGNKTGSDDYRLELKLCKVFDLGTLF